MTVLRLLLLTACVIAVTVGLNPNDMPQCCDCNTMFPSDKDKPELLASPFRIVVADNVNEYRPGNPGEDINVNLTADGDSLGFRSFMIQARRTNSSYDVRSPIGSFVALDPEKVNAVSDCVNARTGGTAFISTDIELKTNVRLAWVPPRDFMGHIEFRATFVVNEKQYWVREKSKTLYDTTAQSPQLEAPRYILPPIAGINVDYCGKRKGCYRIPEGCREIECEYIFTWQDDYSLDEMKFEMSAITDGFNDRYFAVAFSEDTYCGNDFVFECVHNSSIMRVGVYQSLNSPEGGRNERINNPKVGITFEEGSYNDGRLRCRFIRKRAVNDEQIGNFPLTSQSYHIMMGRGPAWKAHSGLAVHVTKVGAQASDVHHQSIHPSEADGWTLVTTNFHKLLSNHGGQILRHGLTVGHLPAVSPDKVDLVVKEDITGRARYPRVKAHAILMLIAWIFFAPIGLLWMKYYTTMWPNSRFLGERYWLVAHFNCTVWTVILVIIGVIIIFVEAGGWTNFPDLPQRAHPILGIIIFICILVIPILFLIRCPEGHTCRPIGNWFYWLFWTIAFCLAIPNIFIGMEFGKAMVPWWLTWILCIFFLFNLVCEVILEVHQCCTHKKNKERRKKWELQKKENPKVHIPEPWPAGRYFKRNVLYVHFIVCLVVVIIAVITVAVS